VVLIKQVHWNVEELFYTLYPFTSFACFSAAKQGLIKVTQLVIKDDMNFATLKFV